MEALLILGGAAVINHLTGGSLVDSFINAGYKTSKKWESEGRGNETTSSYINHYENGDFDKLKSKKDE